MNSSDQYKPELLIILSRFPYPLEKGDKLRAYYQMAELSKSFRITLFAISDSPVSKEQINKVEQFCTAVHVHQLNRISVFFRLFITLFSSLPLQTGYFYAPAAAKKIRRLIATHDVKHIYCQLIRTTEYVKNIHHIPKTLDYMDALSAGISRRIDREPFYKKWIFRMESRRLIRYEQQIFDFFEHHTIISDQDRNLIMHPNRNKILCIPNGIGAHFFEDLTRTESYDFVFVGNMSYPPNVDAVHYIAREILPELKDATLLVSGATPHPSIEKLANNSDSITLTGWVDDIRESYLDGKVFLAPMMIGTGMQNKLLEAMALRTPCITTELANNAIQAKHGEQIMVGNTKEELLSLAHQLLDDTSLRAKIASNGYAFVKEKYSWEKSTAELAALMLPSNP